MEYDRDGEFERIMEEIFPISIPASFVKRVEVTLTNGQSVSLKSGDLIYPLPMNNTSSWSKLVENFDSIADVEVQIDIPAIQENVVINVKNILKNHFEDKRSND